MSVWTSWLYCYGVGGIIFTTSLLALLSSGALRLSRKTDRRLVTALVAGIVGLGTTHGLWIWAVLKGASQ